MSVDRRHLRRLRRLGALGRRRLGATTRAQAAGLPPEPPPEREIERLAARVDALERAAREFGSFAALDAWIAYAGTPSDLLVSVVLPTRSRVDLLSRAIASVQAQTHEHWELLIVDDRSTDSTPELLASLKDPRIRPLQGAGDGAAAARNRGLDHATGAAIVYLDDDNVMLPRWLQAVAWAFDRNPTRDVVYGARVCENDSALDYAGTGTLPELSFIPFDRGRLEDGNNIDANVLAHRASLAEARWDEQLTIGSDWDLVLRLTERAPPLALPALAVLYSTSSPARLSDSPDPRPTLLWIQEKTRARSRTRADRPG